MDDEEQVIDEFVGGTRADTWRSLRETLEVRLRDAVAERNALPSNDARRALLERKVRELKEQVAALAQEEIVTQFVEDTVRASLNRPRLDTNDEDDV